MIKRNILVVGPGWIGDLIISISLIKALKEKNTNANIDILVNSNLYSLAKMIPGIRNVLSSKTKHGSLSLFYRLCMGYSLRSSGYSECYVLPNSFKSAIIPFLAGIKKRISYLGELRYGLINQIKVPIDRTSGMVNKYLNLADTNYTEKLKPEIKLVNIKNITKKFNLPKKYYVICPDADYGPSKRWPIKKWSDLASSLSKEYTVVAIGLDENIGKKFEEISSKRIINLIGKTSLDEVLEILSMSQLVVTNDSGLMHIAASLDKKIVALYGSSSPLYTPPLINNSKKAIIYKNLSCSPCFKKICPLGHLKCLTSISINEVKDSIKSLSN